jgi:hypothetical protein
MEIGVAKQDTATRRNTIYSPAIQAKEAGS